MFILGDPVSKLKNLLVPVDNNFQGYTDEDGDW